MFSKSNFEKEISESMENSLLEKQAEGGSNLIKVAKAAHLISLASSIFKNAGMTLESKYLNDIIISLSKKYSNQE